MKNKIQEDLKNALKAKNSELVGSLREIISNITTAEKKNGTELSDADIIVVLSALSKKLGKTGDEYKSYAEKDTMTNEMPPNVKDDLLERANKEYYTKSVVDSYLPVQMTEAEIKTALNTVLESIDKDNPKQYNIGFIIGSFKKHNTINGNQMFDTTILSKLIKETL